ncbi:hypothetical protein P886_0894 [Alteromonadaceae bacterium 2753L.S.0a.02]|nr:hypothetical protein P886_0894 [Alteromonadaceae bacterium 2753L.S.0a.02]
MRKLFLLSLLGCLAACTNTPTQNLYYWGDYEQLIYDWYHKPGSAVPSEQIYKLNEVISRAEQEGKAVAPGIFAQLGMMYAMVGNPAAAEQAFREEKARFPESAVFIDGLLERSQKIRAGQSI